MEKTDVALNIFGKPWSTALSLLSLIDKCGPNVGKIWPQFEPVGSKYDTLNPYLILKYLTEKGYNVSPSQPERWLELQPPSEDMLKSFESRSCIRYENAFEKSDAKYLMLIHNDVFFIKNLLEALLKNIGDAFIIGQLGQCWNCPASKESITSKIMNCPPCSPDAYQDFKPTIKQLRGLYAEAKTQGIFARPYDADNFNGEFEQNPWPLPECRVNEWACLINMDKIRNYCVPFGDAWPPGAYRLCAKNTLDIGVPFFRDLHQKNFRAKNFNIKPYLRHWVGTGKKTPIKYAQVEDNSKLLVEKYYPEFINWLKAEGKN